MIFLKIVYGEHLISVWCGAGRGMCPVLAYNLLFVRELDSFPTGWVPIAEKLGTLLRTWFQWSFIKAPGAITSWAKILFLFFFLAIIDPHAPPPPPPHPHPWTLQFILWTSYLPLQYTYHLSSYLPPQSYWLVLPSLLLHSLHCHNFNIWVYSLIWAWKA
jgi:hypothetical protein